MLPDKLYCHMTAELAFRCLKLNTILPNSDKNIIMYKDPYKIGDVRLTVNAGKLSLSYSISEFQINTYRVVSISVPELSQFVSLIELDRGFDDKDLLDSIKMMALQKGIDVRYHTY